MQLMQDYMGQATPQVLEATGRETTRRKGKDVARAGAQASTEAMMAKGKAQFDMNRKIAKEAAAVAKQTALVSAGATLLGQMATVGIPKWKEQREIDSIMAETAPGGRLGSAPRHLGFDDIRVDEGLLTTMGEAATGKIPPKPPLTVWPEKLDGKSIKGGEFVLKEFFNGSDTAYDQWYAKQTKKPRDWKAAFDMLAAQRTPQKASAAPPKKDLKEWKYQEEWELDPGPQTPWEIPAGPGEPLARGIPGVDAPLDAINSFGLGVA
jgi:hypothetical protein